LITQAVKAGEGFPGKKIQGLAFEKMDILVCLNVAKEYSLV